MKVGYARVSTFEQNLNLQMNALEKEGCDRIFFNQGESGAKGGRPDWDNCLDYLRKGDTLVICKRVGISRASYYRLVAPKTVSRAPTEERTVSLSKTLQ